MSTKIVRVGRGHLQTEQVITNTFGPGELPTAVHEHVTLSTPPEITDTQRLRLMTALEARSTWQR